MFDFSKKLVLFDRDGVLNENALVRRPEELRLLSNALRGIARLTRAGFRVGVCTNQGAIARGALDEAMLAQVHARLLLVAREFGGDIARIVFCASADAAHFGVALTGVPFVGDSLADIEAARAAGAVPVLVKTGNGRAVAHKWRGKLDDVAVYANVESAVDSWLKEAA